MDLIKPDDPRYDEARTVFNAMIDKRPAVIARCAIRRRRDRSARARAGRGYDVAVRAGGHSVAGMSINDGGIVIDVRPMKTIEVDPGAARCASEPASRGASSTAPRRSTGWPQRVAGCRRPASPAHARRRVGLAGAQLRPGVRQPGLRRSRHRRRARGHRERDREPRPVLGAARRRRQLRRRDVVRVPAPPRRPDGDRRAA